MAVEIRFTDLLIDQIASTLAVHEPERGGALLVAGGLVHQLIEDTSGRYTGVSWDISRELTTDVQAAERSGHGELAGTVHTHPAGTPDPSGQDMHTTARLLDENEHLQSALICVVTRGEPRDGDLAISDTHRMSVHVARRAPGGRVQVSRSRASIVAIGGDLRTAGWPVSTPGLQVRQQGSDRLGLTIERDESSLLLLVPRDYPLAGPVLVDSAPGGELVPLSRQSWDPTLDTGRQLTTMFNRAFRVRPAGFGDRIEGLAGHLSQQRVLVAGVGSVGSWLVEELARAGVGHLDIIDPDHVSGSNLARTTFEADHLGVAKVDAASELCARINPAIEVTVHEAAIGELGDVLADACREADLVVAATDDPADQALLGHHAYAAGTPLVACALYRRAEAGEVVVVVPDVGTPCWVCATGSRSRGGEKDYGTGRLVAELALGPAIHLVAEAAAGIAIGLLAGPGTPAGDPIGGLLASRRTMGLISTAPIWDFFPKVFAELQGHQWAPQSIWAQVRADPDCAVCGEDRTDPLRDQGPAIAAVVARRRAHLAGAADGVVPDDLEVPKGLSVVSGP